MSNNKTAGQRTAADLAALLRARNALLWVATPEEARAERGIIEAAASAQYEVRLWDCVSGVTDATGKVQQGSSPDPDSVLAYILNTNEEKRLVWVMRDIDTPWLKAPTTVRALRNLARKLADRPRNRAQAIVVLAPTAEVPPALADQAVVVKWPLPDRDEIAGIYDEIVQNQSEAVRAAIEAAGVREQAVEAAVGLSQQAAVACYSKSLVTQRTIVPADIAAEKRRVVNQGKGIEWFEPDPRGLAAVGGLENLKAWLRVRQSAFSQRAREYGLPPPKGMLLLGPPGTGKSLTAKAISAAWQLPLLRLDMGGAKSKWLGESEQNIRGALAIAEAVGNCVVWVDEIEKALGGAVGGAADGGVSADALGTLLQWMQERKGAAFVVATSNDVRMLPPELLRKGRFDEIFFVDLPTRKERAEIVRVTLSKFDRARAEVDADEVARACEGFVGAEIAALVSAAMFAAFADGERPVRTADLLAEARATVPLSKTAEERIKALREWAKDRARFASPPEEESVGGGSRAASLDM